MRRITLLERHVIEICFASGKSNARIAKILGRDRRVIDREIKRNTLEDREYSAKLAEELTQRRQLERCKAKLEKDEPLRRFVIDNLRNELSPEQIAGLLKNETPKHLKNKYVCHETIYQYIYEGRGQYEYLYPHLRRAKKRRVKQGKRKHRKVQIIERISIHNRPAVIDEKKTFW